MENNNGQNIADMLNSIIATPRLSKRDLFKKIKGLPYFDGKYKMLLVVLTKGAQESQQYINRYLEKRGAATVIEEEGVTIIINSDTDEGKNSEKKGDKKFFKESLIPRGGVSNRSEKNRSNRGSHETR